MNEMRIFTFARNEENLVIKDDNNRDYRNTVLIFIFLQMLFTLLQHSTLLNTVT